MWFLTHCSVTGDTASAALISGADDGLHRRKATGLGGKLARGGAQPTQGAPTGLPAHHTPHSSDRSDICSAEAAPALRQPKRLAALWQRRGLPLSQKYQKGQASCDRPALPHRHYDSNKTGCTVACAVTGRKGGLGGREAEGGGEGGAARWEGGGEVRRQGAGWGRRAVGRAVGRKVNQKGAV